MSKDHQCRREVSCTNCFPQRCVHRVIACPSLDEHFHNLFSIRVLSSHSDRQRRYYKWLWCTRYWRRSWFAVSRSARHRRKVLGHAMLGVLSVACAHPVVYCRVCACLKHGLYFSWSPRLDDVNQWWYGSSYGHTLSGSPISSTDMCRVRHPASIVCHLWDDCPLVSLHLYMIMYKVHVRSSSSQSNNHICVTLPCCYLDRTRRSSLHVLFIAAQVWYV